MPDECRRPSEIDPDADPSAPPALIDDVSELYPRLHVAPRAITAQNAYLLTDMMQDVVRRGTGAAAWRALRRLDLAGKTGTSNDGRDAWFSGYNADMVATAWVGFDQDRPLGGNEQGGVTAIPIWIDFMREALDSLPEHPIARPPGIVEVRINPSTGLAANGANPSSQFEKFRIGHVPAREPDTSFPAQGPTPGQGEPEASPIQKIF
jgi:penicillin-binding protein 1A